MALILSTPYQTILTELSQHTRNIFKQMLFPPDFIYLQNSFQEEILSIKYHLIPLNSNQKTKYLTYLLGYF